MERSKYTDTTLQANSAKTAWEWGQGLLFYRDGYKEHQRQTVHFLDLFTSGWHASFHLQMSKNILPKAAGSCVKEKH